MTATTATAGLESARTRSRWTLFAGVGLGSTGYIAASTVSAVVATELAGSSALAGVPAATVVLGSAFGSAALSVLMSGHGRRSGLVTGYVVGAIGALLAVSAVLAGSFLLFLLGTADSGPCQQREPAVAVRRRGHGPLRAARGRPGSRGVGRHHRRDPGPQPGHVHRAGSWRRSGYRSSWGCTSSRCCSCRPPRILSFVFLRPDPSRLAWMEGSSAAPTEGAGPPPTAPRAIPTVRELLHRPAVEMAVVALVMGQVVMVLIMTMTPVHMTEHGHDIAAVGLVISGHVFGMFALSPVSGRLTDSFGSLPVIMAGLAVMAVSAVVAATAPADGGPLLFLALFLLGFGWNLGFVAGSTLLSSGLASAERTRIQGTADALIWCSAAAASLGSGVVQSVAGFTALCVLALALAVVPAALLLSRWRATSGAALQQGGS